MSERLKEPGRDSLRLAGRFETANRALTERTKTMDGIWIEIRAGEGGDDAKLLVREQLAVYAKAAKRSRL
jgi:protein subunit release factor A